MAGEGWLDDGDRAFLTAVGDIVFTNPFDESGLAGLRALGLRPTLDKGAHRHHLNALAQPLAERIAALERKGQGRIQAFAEPDRGLVEHGFLFSIFHRFIDELDALIEAQREQPEPVAVPFADQVLAQLKTRGFSDTRSLHYLALFFQLRRAYFFIVRSLVGESACMKGLRRKLWNNVFTYDVRLYDRHLWDRMEDFSTLLLGETGSGKGAAAAAIGRSGYIPFDRRRGCFVESFARNFIAINLSQFPESLIESELFGHRKGAFTGAIDHHQGVFERCSTHGALFLDEIGDISIPVQIKLLQVLQERRYTPVGSHTEGRFSGRVIGATHRPLDLLRQEGRFRNDFYYRLSSDVITVPPLRQRIAEDARELERLVVLLVRRAVGAEHDELVERVMDALRDLPTDYAWPGNVRELEQAVRRILLSERYRGDVAASAPAAGRSLAAELAEGTLDAREVLSRYCGLLYDKFGTFEEVARRTQLDRRTVKKYVQAGGR
jgi:hypothetical protein